MQNLQEDNNIKASEVPSLSSSHGPQDLELPNSKLVNEISLKATNSLAVSHPSTPVISLASSYDNSVIASTCKSESTVTVSIGSTTETEPNVIDISSTEKNIPLHDYVPSTHEENVTTIQSTKSSGKVWWPPKITKLPSDRTACGAKQSFKRKLGEIPRYSNFPHLSTKFCKRVSKKSNSEQRVQKNSLPILSDIRSIASDENITDIPELIDKKVIIVTRKQIKKTDINEVKNDCIEPSMQQNPASSNTIRPFSKPLSVFCTAIRIGSFEIHPFSDLSCLFVLVSSDCFFFQVPKAKASGLASITLKKTDLKGVTGHFTLSLRLISLKTTPQCTKRIRSQLGMEEGDATYYDPFGENVAQRYLTFILDSTEDLMCHKRIVTHFMEIFPGLDLFNVERDTVEQDMADKNETAQEYFQEVSIPEIPGSSILLKLTSVDNINHSLAHPAASPLSLSLPQKSASSKSVNLFCCSIRIGSYEVQPLNSLSYLSVIADNNSFAFKVPKISNRSALVSIFLENHDITQFIGHFGCCLPLISLQTSVSCANKITRALNMQRRKTYFYDPKGTDEKEKRITFMIDTSDYSLPCEEMKRFLKKTTLANTSPKFRFKHLNGTTSVYTSNQETPYGDQCDIKYLHELISKSIENEIEKRYWLLKSKLVIEYFKHNKYEAWMELPIPSPSLNGDHDLMSWTAEEDSLIYDAYMNLDSEWCHILPLLLPWRSEHVMKVRWSYLKQENENKIMNNQLKKDEAFLSEFKKEVHSTKWATLTKQLKEKIHLHYENSPYSLWSVGEVDSLYELYKASGDRWNKIASHLPGRTGDSIKKFENILKKFSDLRQQFNSSHFQLNASSTNNNLDPSAQEVLNSNTRELINSLSNISVNEESFNNIDVKLENRSTCDEIMDYVANNIKKEILNPEEMEDSTTCDVEYSITNNCSKSDIQNFTQNKKCLLCNPTDDAFEISMADLVKMHNEICMYVKNKNTVLDNVDNNDRVNSDCSSSLPEIPHKPRKNETNDQNCKTTVNNLQSWSRKRHNRKQRKETETSIESHLGVASSNTQSVLNILLHEPLDINAYQECATPFVSLPIEIEKSYYDLSTDICSTPVAVIPKTSFNSELNHLQEKTNNFLMGLLLSKSHESFGHSSHGHRADVNSKFQKCSLLSTMPYDNSKKKTKSSLPESSYKERSNCPFLENEANIPYIDSPSDSLPSFKNDDESEDTEIMELSDDCGNDKQVFSKEEDKKLKELVDIFGVDGWKFIAKRFPDHSAIQCRKRWHKISKKSHPCVWTKEEDEKLSNLVNEYGSKKFKFLSKHFDKTHKQCKKRWFNHLNPAIKNTPWTPAEETIVIQACKNWGRNWSKIASFLGGRREIDIKTHWKSTLRKRVESQELFSFEKSKLSLSEILKLEKCLKSEIAQGTALQPRVLLTRVDLKTIEKEKIPFEDYKMPPNALSGFHNISLKIKFGDSSIIVTGDKNSKSENITSSFEELSHQAVNNCLSTEKEIIELPNDNIFYASTDEESVSSNDTVVYSTTKSAKDSEGENFLLTPVMDMKRKYETICPQSDSEKHLQNFEEPKICLADAESFDYRKIFEAEKLLKGQIANGTAPEVRIIAEKLTNMQKQGSNSQLIQNCEVSTQAQISRINCAEVAEPMLWSIEEDDQLEEIVNTYGRKWNIVANFFPGRGAVECRLRWFTAVSPQCKKMKLLEKDNGQKLTINQFNFTKTNFIIGQLKKKRKRHKARS